MEMINISLRFMAASQIILFMLLVGGSNNLGRVRAAGLFLMLGALMYLLVPMVQEYTNLTGLDLLWYPAAVAPSSLLVFIWLVFEEDCSMPAPMIALIAFSMMGSLWYQYLGVGLPGSPNWLYAIKILIVSVAIYIIHRGRDSDLVEIRFKVRNAFILSLSLLILVNIALQIVTDFNIPKDLDNISTFITLLITFIGNYSFIKLNPTLILSSPPIAPKKESDDPVIQQLLVRMKSERLYADHDLRVASLANNINIPEYQLRKKINQQLGYRNFNQFINHYRIKEAAEKLLDDRRTPVLSIALDVGFRSISSFNTAFHMQFGVSPTKYRLEAS